MGPPKAVVSPPIQNPVAPPRRRSPVTRSHCLIDNSSLLLPDRFSQSKITNNNFSQKANDATSNLIALHSKAQTSHNGNDSVTTNEDNTFNGIVQCRNQHNNNNIKSNNNSKSNSTDHRNTINNNTYTNPRLNAGGDNFSINSKNNLTSRNFNDTTDRESCVSYDLSIKSFQLDVNSPMGTLSGGSSSKHPLKIAARVLFGDRNQTSGMPLSLRNSSSVEASPVDTTNTPCQLTKSSFSLPNMQPLEDLETKRRNFSSSSLPLGLMSSTIEEVEDADVLSGEENGRLGNQRSHSYAGIVTPSPRVPLRVLKREANVSITKSPPRSRNAPPGSGHLIRSSSDNLSRIARLRDMDIVGQSFESRYPWQRDVSIQCTLEPSQPCHPPELYRSASSPASYSYCRSLSLNSNSPASSPPQPCRRLALSQQNSNNSNNSSCANCSPNWNPSNFNPLSVHQANGITSTATPCACANGSSCSPFKPFNKGTQPAPPVASLDLCPKCLSEASSTPPYNNRRANFFRRPRPNSMGAVENIR